MAFYDNFSLAFTYKKSIFKEYLSSKYGSKFDGKNELLDFSNDVFFKINRLYNSDINSKYHNYEIYIYPTKETEAMYNQIEIIETKNETMSEFIRNLLNEYVKEPGFEREKCLYRKKYITIIDAIETARLLSISSTRNIQFDFKPFKILKNAEEDHNYLVGLNMSSKSPQFFSIKLSKIASIVVKDECFTFTQNELKRIHDQLKNGPEFFCKEMTHAVIQLDKKGIKKYNACYKDRPSPTSFNNETGKYVFDTDINKLYLYLLQFGKHVKIIEPIFLKDKLNTFHKEAINEE